MWHAWHKGGVHRIIGQYHIVVERENNKYIPKVYNYYEPMLEGDMRFDTLCDAAKIEATRLLIRYFDGEEKKFNKEKTAVIRLLLENR